MSKGHVLLKFLRKVHLYIGIFTTPALLFFAMTGAFQTFSLHETTQGSSYKPPAWIATLAQLHKKQTTVVPPHRIRSAGPENAAPPAPHAEAQSAPPQQARAGLTAAGQTRADAPSAPQAPRKTHLPMKLFFLLVSLSLITSTLTGIYLSYKYSRGWWVLTGLLIAGVIVPLLLLPF